MGRKKIVRFLVPAIMVIIVISMYFLQIAADSSNVSEQDSASPTSLHAPSINLQALKSHNMPMILDFGATECEPCKAMAPVLETLNEEMQNRAIIKFVDVWEFPQGSQGFPIVTIPTQVFIEADGSPYIPSADLGDLGIEFIIYPDEETQEPAFTVHQGALTEDQMRAILKDMGIE